MSVRPLLRLLTPDDVEAIVGEACAVLGTVGVAVESALGRRLLLEAGGQPAGDRLTIPESAVREAVASAPRSFVVFDRGGAPVLDLGGTRVHYDPGSAAIYVLDAATGRRRPPITADLVALARLVDGLPHYAAQSTALTPGDVPESMADRYRLYLALKHGRKPVVTGTFRSDGFAPMHAMLAAVRGGEAELAAQPLALFDCCPTSPLKWSDLTCQALMDCARTLVPAQIVPVPMTGATAPVTLRETVVQHCAECLSGVVLHQQARRGAPVVFGGAPAAFDMRRGTAVMSAMESLMIDVAYAQVGQHLGLPTHTYMGLSDTKAPDYQAGMETAMGALLAALAGVNVVSGPGLLDYLLSQSLEKVLLDHEACGMALRLVQGIEKREGDAVALIGDVARLGQFLSHPHTRRNWRDELGVASRLLDRETYGDWLAGGAKDAVARAREEVASRLEKASVPSLAPDVEAALESTMRAEASRAGLTALPGAR